MFRTACPARVSSVLGHRFIDMAPYSGNNAPCGHRSQRAARVSKRSGDTPADFWNHPLSKRGLDVSDCVPCARQLSLSASFHWYGPVFRQNNTPCDHRPQRAARVSKRSGDTSADFWNHPLSERGLDVSGCVPRASAQS